MQQRSEKTISSKSSIDIDQLVAIARISRKSGKPQRYRITTKGDGLKSLTLPERAWLYRSPGAETNILKPVQEGLDPAGDVMEIEIDRVHLHGADGWIEFRDIRKFAPRQDGEEPDEQNPAGAWVCVTRDRLIESKGPDEVYCFELKECVIRESIDSVEIARVKDYFETGAHGVLQTVLPDGRECLIPFIPEFVDVRLEERSLIIPRFSEFIIE